MTEKTVILHLIPELSNGGAENSLYKLLSNIDKSKFESKVIVLNDFGPLSNQIKSIGIPVFSCNIRNNFFGIFKRIVAAVGSANLVLYTSACLKLCLEHFFESLYNQVARPTHENLNLPQAFNFEAR